MLGTDALALAAGQTIGSFAELAVDDVRHPEAAGLLLLHKRLEIFHHCAHAVKEILRKYIVRRGMIEAPQILHRNNQRKSPPEAVAVNDSFGRTF